MRATKVRARNFRCFDFVESTVEPSLTLFVGANGIGKTTILDIISFALGGLGKTFGTSLGSYLYEDDFRRTIQFDGGSPVSNRESTLEVVVDLQLSPDVRGSALRFADIDEAGIRAPSSQDPLRRGLERIIKTKDPHIFPWPLVAYYRSDRFLSNRRILSATTDAHLDEYRLNEAPAALDEILKLVDDKTIPERKSGWSSALDAGMDWKSTKAWWSYEYLAAAMQGRAISDLAICVEEAVACAISSSTRPQWSPIERDIVVALENQRTSTVSSLSDGYRMMICLFADLARRCAILNSHLGRNAPHETPGIVLIDEIELHLHPGWQRRVLPALQRAFPGLQFIVTTHSPQVLSSVRAFNIRTIGEGVIRIPSSQTWRRDTNAILESVFHDAGRPAEVAREFHVVREHVDLERYAEARVVLQRLREMLEGEDSEIVFYESLLPPAE